MGNYYAHHISKLENVNIVRCCDPSETKLNRFRKKWNIPSGTIDWKELFQSNETLKDIDGVVNSSSDKLHGEIFNACIRAGVALLAEKPFAVSFKILKTLKAEDLINHIFVINFSKRVLPAVANAQKAVKNNLLGKIHRMELHYRQGWVLNHDYGDWHNTSAWFWRLTDEFSQHGVLGDLGSHLFDLTVFFCGSVENLFCSMNRIDKGDNKLRNTKLDSMDDVQCLLQMHNGAHVIVNASRTAPGEKDSLEILISGDKGSIRILPEESRDSFQLFLIEDSEWQTIPCPQKTHKNLESFVELIRNKKISDYPGIRDALYNHVMIEAAAASAQQGCRFDLDAFGEQKLEAKWNKIVMQN